LCAQLIDGLQKFERVKILGPIDQLKKQGHLVSFVVDGIHAHDVAAYLDQHGIAVRAGHHCAQPLAKKLGVESSVRVSFYCYNTADEVDELLQVMEKLLL
jgi:cysteine desulfurase/selenocysteine lyase